MLALGILAIAVLSVLPRSFTQIASLKEHVDSSFTSPHVETSFNSSPSDPTATPRIIKREALFDISAWYNSKNEQPDTHGVLIESEDGSQLYASHNPDVTFNPASLIKLSTTLASLKTLGADYRFQTRVYAEGPIDRSGTLQGTLFVAGNDPTFGDAAANMIANELRSRGIKRVSKSVSVSSKFCFNFSDSPEESANRLIKSLRIGSAKAEISDQQSGDNILTVSSNPLRDVLLYMNAHSNNFIAEHIGDLIGGPEGLQRFLVEQLKLPEDQVTIERTSGREHNRMTPRGLLAVIRGLYQETERQGLQPSDVMAVASDDSGTLRRRLAGTGLEGSVVAKTGTLTHEVDGGMASLAGIVYTKDAGPVVFAILDQGNRIAENRQMEDQLLAEVIHRSATPRLIASPTPRRMLPSSNVSVAQN
jgi:D-alanyl-D-alanine carboxypeptidase/D-alanyl-D-alanine-endopeptidase (penicillin-binding protein 4)